MKDLTWMAAIFTFPVHKCPQDATLHIRGCTVFNRGTTQILSWHTHLMLLSWKDLNNVVCSFSRRATLSSSGLFLS